MKFEVDFDPTPKQIAEAFTNLTDDDMAQVFIEVAEIAKDWEGRAEWQWLRIGEHLRTCSCGTSEAEDMLRAIVFALDGPQP